MWLTTVWADGVAFTVAKLDASVHLSLQAGGELGGNASIPGSVLPSTVAAFNGGFKFDTGQSGLFVGGIQTGVFGPGMAAVVGYTNGTFALGQIGRDVAPPGPGIAWERSNLPLLVDGGAPSAQVGDAGAWGTPLSSVGLNTARSALGIDGSGNWLFAAAANTYPAALAHALVQAGAVRAMELDINPQWPMLCSLVGGVPTTLVSYLGNGCPYTSWSGRDFFMAQVS